MNQLTFSDMEYSNRKKKTKREEFLDAMEEIIPWSYWVEMIRPYYFANKRGRKPIGIETMLRMYLMQIWFNLSDEGIEDSIYDSYAMRSFMHIDFGPKRRVVLINLLAVLSQRFDLRRRLTACRRFSFNESCADLRPAERDVVHQRI